MLAIRLRTYVFFSLCTVNADSTKFKNAHKLWIPEKSEFDKKSLWYNQANTDVYIQHYKLNPASKIRFSYIWTQVRYRW